MQILNLGILAHVDAGKTTLTERLLFAAGVIDKIGRVDDGSTQTDSLALEQKHGITIKSAVVSFAIAGVTVNLIDTPGHPDFIAEVERVLNVMDGAVLVVSAVEGVQAQTRILMRTLQRLNIPTLIFVNKIDRGGAQYDDVLKAISEKLTPQIVPMGRTSNLGTRDARFAPYSTTDRPLRALLVDLLADHDASLLSAYVDDEAAVSHTRLRDELADQTKRAQMHPVFFGSAVTGEGVDALMTGIAELLPADSGNATGPVSGTVFKVDRGPSGEKVAYVRMFSGTARTRDRLQLRMDEERKVTAISVFDQGSVVRCESVAAGQIAKLSGLGDIQIGDPIGIPRSTLEGHFFAPPTLETVIVPRDPGDKGRLHVALTQLEEQDPLINLRQDDARQELFVSLYGEVQKEVIQETLAADFDIDVDFRETTMICIERPIGVGAAVEIIGKPPNPFAATVGLRIEPAAIGSGVEYRLEVELGSLPLAFHKAVEETVHETLHQGVYGWRVTDCTVTLTDSGYWARPGSSAGDFRYLTPLVLMSALAESGTKVCEPIHHFHIEAPADALGRILGLLGRLHAIPETPVMTDASCTLEGAIPAVRVHELQQRLPGLTRGEGVVGCVFDSYRTVRGANPTRQRTDHNPLNRREYLTHLARRD
ncbi:MAG: TetM/TetW/TetO/TetS family tetracycline resistance ribosomal protection protein [Actinomycetota bacterium]|nr:TetM/TetW/TetO/TetS family tetracycline resistance ribosomal protection protein [Actinomycetota bacterium]